MTEHTFLADKLWRDGDWQQGVELALDGQGRVSATGTHVADTAAEHIGGPVLPGICNVHSHAFQRAMAGLAERRGRDDDSFWTWREVMYAFAGSVDPDDLRVIARQLYLEMLKAGYTRVCEFHYLHRRPDGGAYADPAAMSMALIDAAGDVGIGLTLLPVLYQTGGFDGRPLGPRQQRFGLEVDEFLRLLEQLRTVRTPGFSLGLALHSLRAVPVDALQVVLDAEVTRGMPVHIHIAEQPAEVNDCLALRGARPVEWLLANADVDARWCLVHATHVVPAEVSGMAASGAVVGLCPTTEANLGDGLFPLTDYLEAGGQLAIGSDSNVSVSPVEELRWLEYGQRLVSGRRNIVTGRSDSVGASLWQAALAGGQRAAGQPVPLQAGFPADLLVLDAESPLLAGHDTDTLLDAFIFAGNTPLVRDVMCGGRWRIRDFHHPAEERIAQDYRATVQRLVNR